MADPSSRRKLAAILSADVVGYSRLMAANEAATVETLKAYRDIIARLVARRGGRVVNAPSGDALLAEFPSAVEAVQAAIEIQQSVEGHNIELEADRRMQFRIGVNLGDVIEEADGTIYGDGVNIAARMEALARGRRRLHLLQRLRRRRRQARLGIRFFGRAPGQEYCEAGPRLPRARRAQASVGAH
jgi:class 3 adenylate cyclase